MATQLYLIRHCETSGQEPHAALTSRGVSQAQELATKLKKLDFKRIVSSPYRRAVQSAVPLAHALGLELETDERLCERKLGDVGTDWLVQLARTFDNMALCFPNGESSDAATHRALAAIHEIIERSNGPAVVMTHGDLLALIARKFVPTLGFEFWKQLKNPDVYEIRIDRPSFVNRVAL